MAPPNPATIARGSISAVLATLVLLFVPWTLTSPGAFVVGPVAAHVVSSAERGVIAQIFVREGTRVDAGAPLLRVVNHDLERGILTVTRTVDSLALEESVARSNGRSGDASRLTAERAAAEARLATEAEPAAEARNNSPHAD